MASSGTINNTFRTGYAIRIVWNTTQNIANNTSTVTAKVQLVSLGSAYTISSTTTKSGTLTINGTAYSFNFTAALAANQTKTLFTTTTTINHNADGSKTCAFAVTAGINVTLSGVYWGNVTASGNGVFDTIPRASSFSVTSSVAINGTNASAVTITRASSNFTHTVVWKFGSYTKTTTGAATSASYVLPLEWLNAIPNATSGIGTVTVTTFNGTSQIGSAVSKTFTVTVPASVVPVIATVSLQEATETVKPLNVYVQNKTALKGTITASGAYSSTIKSCATTILGQTYHGTSFTSGILTTNGTINVVTTVTDTRGRTATKTTEIIVVRYASPTISTFTCTRSNADGTENADGQYATVKMAFAIASVNNANTYLLQYKKQSDSTWETLATGNAYTYNSTYVSTTEVLEADYAYNVKLTLTDSFTTVEQTFNVGTAFTLMDFNATGKGVAIGKVSEKDALEVNMDIYDKYNTKIRNGVANNGGDPNTTLEELIVTSTNAPTANLYYIRTIFIDTKSTTAKRIQIAYPYSVKESIYYRQYFSSWTAWMEQPVIVSQGTSGIWTYRTYSDGTAECWGKIAVSSTNITTAFGSMYRCPDLWQWNTHAYPVTFKQAPVLEMIYQSNNGNGATLWTVSGSTDYSIKYVPSAFLFRPTSATGTTGNINIYAKGNI